MSLKTNKQKSLPPQPNTYGSCSNFFFHKAVIMRRTVYVKVKLLVWLSDSEWYLGKQQTS